MFYDFCFCSLLQTEYSCGLALFIVFFAHQTLFLLFLKMVALDILLLYCLLLVIYYANKGDVRFFQNNTFLHFLCPNTVYNK